MYFISQSEIVTLISALMHFCIFLLPTSVRANCGKHVNKYCSEIDCQQIFMSKKLDMHMSCQDLRFGLTDVCHSDCENAIVEFLQAYNGSEDFFLCNCTDELTPIYNQNDCEMDRQHLRICPPVAALLPPEDQTPSCIAQSQDCESDTDCKARLDAYLQNCDPEKADPQLDCSPECMDTLEELKSDSLASNFWGCSCVDEAPHKWCRTSPSEYYELCKGHNMFTTSSPEVPYKPLTTKPTLPSATKVDKSDTKKQQAVNSNTDKPGGAAPSINTGLVYQIMLLIVSFFVWML